MPTTLGFKWNKGSGWVLACVMVTLPLMSVVFTLPTTLVMLRAMDAFVWAVISGSSSNTLPCPSVVCTASVRLSMPLSVSLHVIATWNAGDAGVAALSSTAVS